MQVEEEGQDSKALVYTHALDGPPDAYRASLSLAMGHFDAESLISDSGERTLTAEERETVDGCKLLQGLLIDEDRSLAKLRSFSAYEHDLSSKVIPLIRDNFEELDEDSTEVLGDFFRWHGIAVRVVTALETRKLLRTGGDGGSSERHDIPADVTLQKYALDYCLSQSQLDYVSVGLPKISYADEFLNSSS